VAVVAAARHGGRAIGRNNQPEVAVMAAARSGCLAM